MKYQLIKSSECTRKIRVSFTLADEIYIPENYDESQIIDVIHEHFDNVNPARAEYADIDLEELPE